MLVNCAPERCGVQTFLSGRLLLLQSSNQFVSDFFHSLVFHGADSFANSVVEPSNFLLEISLIGDGANILQYFVIYIKIINIKNLLWL